MTNTAQALDPEWKPQDEHGANTAKEGAPPSKLSLFAILVFALIFFFPLSNITFHLIKDRTLNGLALPEHFPTLSFQSFKDESFQKSFEAWAMKRNGIWGWLVAISNQISFSIFDQASNSYKVQVLKGEEYQLFQPMYLKSFNRIRTAKVSFLSNKVKVIKKLQDKLEQSGVKLIVLISTNAIAQYPELVPNEFVNPARLQKENSYEIMRPLLDDFHINYVDAHELLQNLKPQYPFRFFSPTGSHWNEVAACLVSDQVLAKFALLSNSQVPRLICNNYELKPTPQGADVDLLQIANLLFDRDFRISTPYLRNYQTIVPPSSQEKDTYRPKMLFVGTSFLFSVIDMLEKHNAATEFPLYFYFRQFRNRSEDHLQTLDTKHIDWQKSVLSKDVIVLEANMSNLGLIGFGFEKALLRYLKK